MSQIEEKVAERLSILPIEKQQQVLEYIEFLCAKLCSPILYTASNSDYKSDSSEKTKLFGEVADRYAGCLEGGPEDLSTNKVYIQSFGEMKAADF